MSKNTEGTSFPEAYILNNSVTHARFLPAESKHSFTYPSLSLLVSLDALERNRLDLGCGYIFGYGDGRARICGLRAKPYMMEDELLGKTSGVWTIRKKLNLLFDKRGLGGRTLSDAWMMTMPSYLGFEGINPLTVYFCYDAQGEMWAVVLEIHNTFGESHVHILQTGVNEDGFPDRGYDHQWTFPRQFHVSPFDDRTGYYRVSVKRPTSAPPACMSSNSSQKAHTPAPQTSQTPKPSVRVYLYTCPPTSPTASPDTDTSLESSHSPKLGPLKLLAVLRPIRSTPLSTSSLLSALAQQPVVLFLTTPRILWHAALLIWQKNVGIWLRPEPQPSATLFKDTIAPSAQIPGGVRWQPPTLLERYARSKVEAFLEGRVQELSDMEIRLVPVDPWSSIQVFGTSTTTRNGEETDRKVKRKTLTITYLAHRFFTLLLRAPSVELALALGCMTSEHDSSSTSGPLSGSRVGRDEGFETWQEREMLFQVNDRRLFCEIFAQCLEPIDTPLSTLQRLRLWSSPLPNTFATTNPSTSEVTPSSSAKHPVVPPTHILDAHDTNFVRLVTMSILLLHTFLDHLEKLAYRVLRVGVVDEAVWSKEAKENWIGSVRM